MGHAGVKDSSEGFFPAPADPSEEVNDGHIIS